MAATIMALPASGLAQTPQPSEPQGQQPTAPPTQPPTTQPAPTTQPPQGAAQPDQDAAKRHLTAARNALSEMTQMPEASQLTGETRTQVSELISNFNNLISTTTDWSSAYAKVEASLNALIGPPGSADEPPRAGTEGAVGTSGAGGITPGIRAKLAEFRTHMEQFEQAAGCAGPASEPASGGSAAATTPPSAAASPSSAGAGAAAYPQGSQPGAPPAQSSTISRDEALQHIQAIENLLDGQPAASGTPGAAGTAGTTTPGAEPPLMLDAAKVQQLRSHLAELKRILGDR